MCCKLSSMTKAAKKHIKLILQNVSHINFKFYITSCAMLVVIVVVVFSQHFFAGTGH